MGREETPCLNWTNQNFLSRELGLGLRDSTLILGSALEGEDMKTGGHGVADFCHVDREAGQTSLQGASK